MTQTVDVDAFVRFEAAGWRRAGLGDAYHRFFGPITAWAVEPLLDAAAVGPGTRTLDVATGPGYVAGRAAARSADTIGVDIAPEMVAIAQRLWPDVAFRTADAHALPFDDQRFDAVVANFLVPHLGDHPRAASEFVRVLAPGGRLALSTWDHPERVALLGIVMEAVRLAGAQPPADLPAGPDFFRFADDAAFAALLRETGLAEVTVQRVGFTHRVKSAAELWDGVIDGSVRTAALVRGQPDDVQRQIRVAFDHLVARYRADDGLELPVSVKIAAGVRPT